MIRQTSSPHFRLSSSPRCRPNSVSSSFEEKDETSLVYQLHTYSQNLALQGLQVHDALPIAIDLSMGVELRANKKKTQIDKSEGNHLRCLRHTFLTIQISNAISSGYYVCALLKQSKCYFFYSKTNTYIDITGRGIVECG